MNHPALEEINKKFNLDDSGNPLGDAPAALEDAPKVDDPPEDPPEVLDPPAEEPKGDGFLSYEEYTEGGGDPKWYRGEEAYKKQKSLIETQNEMKASLRTTQDEMANIAFKVDQEYQSKMQALEDQIKVARENEVELHEYDALINERARLQQQSTATSPQSSAQLHPDISDLRQRKPELDPTHPSYNLNLHTKFNDMLFASVNRAAENKGTGLTQAEMTAHIVETESFFVPKESAPPNANRQKASKVAAPGRKANKSKPYDKMSPAHQKMHDDWTKKGMKVAAEKLLKNYEE